MSTSTISIEVDEATASAFSKVSEEDRRKVGILLGLRLREIISNKARPLREVMDEIGQRAQARGLTPEILQSILNDE